MTKNLPPRAVLFGRQAAAAREDLAKAIFGAEAVFTAMVEAAAKGANQFIVRCPEPYDLQQTAAAAALMERLKAEGFRTAWEPVNNPLAPDEPPYFNLRIRWELPST
jgi:hypothetical protein